MSVKAGQAHLNRARTTLLAPQVQAVAAWLIALAPERFNHLLAAKPLAFVRSAVELEFAGASTDEGDEMFGVGLRLLLRRAAPLMGHRGPVRVFPNRGRPSEYSCVRPTRDESPPTAVAPTP